MMHQEPLFHSDQSNVKTSGGLGNSDSRSGYGKWSVLSDLVSHFGRYIAPSYHHERPERSIQMRLYNMQKGQHLLMFIMFLCLFFIALLMGMAGPKMVVEHVESGRKSNETFNPGGPFLLMTPELDSYRQMLWVSGEVLLKGDEDKTRTIIKTLKTDLTIEGFKREGKGRTKVGGGLLSRTRSIECHGISCKSFTVLHLGVIEYKRYVFNISFTGLENIHKHYGISDIRFHLTTYNPEFTVMEIWFRFFFLLISLMVSFFFLITMKSYAFSDWSLEQKWCGFLLSLLINFNNPMFALTLSWKSLIGGAIDVFFQTAFIFGLLLFWLCVFHGLRQTDRTFFSFYLLKVAIVGPMWFSAATIAMLEDMNELRDPTFSYELDVSHYKKFQIFFIAMTATYLVYLLYLAMRAFGELRAMNFLDGRLKFHTATLTLAFALTALIIVNRFGFGVLEDNFIARIYTSYESESQFLAFYTVLNCYIYVLAYAYTPTLAQKRGESGQLLKDNPTFSFVNESESEEDDLRSTNESVLLLRESRSSKHSQEQMSLQEAPPLLGYNEDSD